MPPNDVRQQALAAALANPQPEKRPLNYVADFINEEVWPLGRKYLGPHVMGGVEGVLGLLTLGGELTDAADVRDYQRGTSEALKAALQGQFDPNATAEGTGGALGLIAGNSAMYKPLLGAMLGVSPAARMMETPAALMPPVDGGQRIRAYHGSPHDFDRFDLGRIGTGEGAQAYGHGLYFTDKEGIARHYQGKVSAMHGAGSAKIEGRYIDWDNPVEVAAYELKRHNGDREAAAAFHERTFKNTRVPEILRSGQDLPTVDMPGRLYEVNINAQIDNMLDWDKPLSEQSEAVRNVLADYVAQHDLGRGFSERVRSPKSTLTGREVYEHIGAAVMEPASVTEAARAGGVRGLSSQSASRALREAGIPGIKYRDAGSRGADTDETFNYVIFDDSLIDIKDKRASLARDLMRDFA